MLKMIFGLVIIISNKSQMSIRTTSFYVKMGSNMKKFHENYMSTDFRVILVNNLKNTQKIDDWLFEQKMI